MKQKFLILGKLSRISRAKSIKQDGKGGGGPEVEAGLGKSIVEKGKTIKLCKDFICMLLHNKSRHPCD